MNLFMEVMPYVFAVWIGFISLTAGHYWLKGKKDD